MKLPTNPLQGRRILVTRAAEQAAEFTEQLRQRGAVVVECPTIQLVPPEAWTKVDAAINDLPSFNWLILTSTNGVRFFFTRLQELGRSTHDLQNCKVCAVGPKTAEALLELGITPDLVPEQFTGEGVVAAFQGIDLQGRRILFPKADGARELIPQQLRSMGAEVVDPVVYRNIIPQALPDAARQALEQHQLDAVVFSSPSTVRNLATLVGGVTQLQAMLENLAVASIGPVTTRACQELGLSVAVEPEQATLGALVSDLELYFANTK
ncbi:uroporphyrinogen-III synthase [Trichlorobacter thiogenes]|uniref:uroporphyrinogen-III synthase n=1 Tax=Trichlorobacter thiogenes TaxID=115783 RepID=UPI00137A0332|nr:uroporphyrinogen-III synthase [Trichlorobacter thiogenes]